MKKIAVFCIVLAGCAPQEKSQWFQLSQYPAQNTQIMTDNFDILEPDAYGLGVHKNRYGQAVEVRPDWGYVPDERLEIQTDAYGLGVHSDQYGRPVREYPWPHK